MPELRKRRQDIGLVVGPVAALVLGFALPDSYVDSSHGVVPFTAAGRATAAIGIWMAVWWLTEAISVYATALLPLVLMPLFDVGRVRDIAAPYAHELIFLFMGGFLLALAMERWGLHQRIALVTLRLVGERASHVVAGFMGASAVLSMWVSNTATAIMLLPVATSVIGLVASRRGADETGSAVVEGTSPTHNFSLCLLLGIAYAASIGGMGTPIGTPPNVLVISYIEDHLGLEIGFARWMALALPLVIVLLPLTWWLLTHVLYPVGISHIEGGQRLVSERLRALGPTNRGERIVFCVFLAAAALWVTRPWLAALEIAGAQPFAGLSDAGIAMLAAMVLFVSPAENRPLRFVLDWDTAIKLPWGILVLFGGGLSLASAIEANGVGELLASQVGGLSGVPPVMILFVVVTGIVFLTELTSNTATTATLVPVLAAVAPGLGLEPMMLIVPAALAASCAFMMPVATPPNAIVFGTGLVPITAMSRAGFWLNWLGIVAITAFAYAVLVPALAR